MELKFLSMVGLMVSLIYILFSSIPFSLKCTVITGCVLFLIIDHLKANSHKKQQEEIKKENEQEVNKKRKRKRRKKKRKALVTNKTNILAGVQPVQAKFSVRIQENIQHKNNNQLPQISKINNEIQRNTKINIIQNDSTITPGDQINIPVPIKEPHTADLRNSPTNMTLHVQADAPEDIETYLAALRSKVGKEPSSDRSKMGFSEIAEGQVVNILATLLCEEKDLIRVADCNGEYHWLKKKGSLNYPSNSTVSLTIKKEKGTYSMVSIIPVKIAV